MIALPEMTQGRPDIHRFHQPVAWEAWSDQISDRSHPRPSKSYVSVRVMTLQVPEAAGSGRQPWQEWARHPCRPNAQRTHLSTMPAMSGYIYYDKTELIQKHVN